MKKRIIAAAVSLPLFLAVLLLLPEIATTIMVAAMTAVAAYELIWCTGISKNVALAVVSVLMAILVCFWCHFGQNDLAMQIGLWIYLMVLVCLMIATHGKLSVQEVGVSLLAGLLVPMFLSALIRIRLAENGVYYILTPLVLCFGTDSAAYFVGCAIGKHKMAPILSPKKSWEGAIGGAIGGVALMFLYTFVLDCAFGFDVNYFSGIFYGVLGAVTCILGDLAFSVIKRQTGIKDYGNLLPGHGGILDRFDSMTFVAPLTEILILIVPVIKS